MKPGQHLSREEQAKAEIGHTESTRGINIFLTTVLLVTIIAVPLRQTAAELRDARRWPQSLDVRLLLPTRAELGAIASAGGPRAVFLQLRQVNNRVLRDIGRYEADLRDGSSLVKALVPTMQALITGILRGGNEDAYCGRGNWLFYRKDVDHVMGPGFLDPKVMARRSAGGNELKAAPQPDPVLGVVHFRDQLAARGIELVVVPVPVKPTIHPEHFTARYDGWTQPVQNPSHAEFLRRLNAAGIHVVDPSPLLMEGRTPDSKPVYLATDTHWTPAAMERVAVAVADAARSVAKLPDVPGPAYSVASLVITNTGDVAAMLKLPPGHAMARAETATIRQVLAGSGLWRPEPNADVLLLGDSFANIYSVEQMGWGESAGLAEHLSLALGRKLDALRRNDSGSWATRDMLARELARGNNRLAGKRVVIWEFAARELSAGDWKLIPLQLGTPPPSVFYSPPPGATVPIAGVIRAIAAAPRPGSVPYKDHIIAIHVAELEGGETVPSGGQALVYAWSMRDNNWTAAARWMPGQRIELNLQAWSDVEPRLATVNRAELNDESLMLETPCWGEGKP